MKMRLGYVSNSSSSSFIVVGRFIGWFDKMREFYFEEGKNYIMIGRELCDGVDVISLTPEIFAYLKNSDASVECGEVIEVYKYEIGDSICLESPGDFPSGPIYFRAVEMDQHSTSCFDDVLRNYS